jgi:amino acid permease
MTSWMTFAVTGLRISGEIPVQSDYLPLITLYILLSILYTFVGFTWFIIANELSKKDHLSSILLKIAFVVKKVLFWIFKDKSKTNKIMEIKIEEKNIDMNNENKIKPSETCNFCDRCQKCENRLEEEKKKRLIRDEIRLNVSALNYLAFFILFLTIFTCNTAIWITMNVY